MTNIERNKELVLRFVEQFINRDNTQVVDELIAADYLDHNAPPGQKRGPDGVKATSMLVRQSLQDLRVTTEDVIAEGDRVVIRHCAEAIHAGVFMGRQPTGRRLRRQAISIYRIEEGKLAERWGLLDFRALQKQLDSSN